MKTQDGITLVTSADITSVRQDDDTIDVFTASHDAFGPFDLYIDSAGAGSPLSPLTSKPLGYGAIWGTVDWPNDTDLPKHHLSQRYVAASHMIGALPIGTLPGDTSFKAAIFWSLPSGGYDAWKSNGLDAWRAEAKTLWPALAPFVDQITDADQMTMARYSHGTLNRPYTNRLVHIGDAAHRASPQLGQGANMALLDALALSRALATRTIGQALPAYARAAAFTQKSIKRCLGPSRRCINPTARYFRSCAIASCFPCRKSHQHRASGQALFAAPWSHHSDAFDAS